MYKFSILELNMLIFCFKLRNTYETMEYPQRLSLSHTNTGEFGIVKMKINVKWTMHVT